MLLAVGDKKAAVGRKVRFQVIGHGAIAVKHGAMLHSSDSLPDLSAEGGTGLGHVEVAVFQVFDSSLLLDAKAFLEFFACRLV